MRLFFENRPLATSVLAFALGIASARLFRYAWIFIALAAVALCFVKTGKGPVFKRGLLVVLAICMLAGVARYSLSEAVKPPAPESGDGLLEGTLADDAYLSGGGTTLNFVLENARFKGAPLDRVHVRLYSENLMGITLPKYGAHALVLAQVRLPRGARNPGGYDEALALSAQNIALVATGTYEMASIAPYSRASSPYAALLRFRGAMKAFLSQSLSENQAALLSAMLFGDKSLLDESVHEDFRQSGAAHVLAVSGLHVMALAGALAFVLRKLRASPVAVVVITGLLLLAYCVLAAFSASVIRAAIMALTLVSARVFGRRQDTFTSLCVAALAILIVNPYQLFTAGFQLSFSAVIGIFALQKPLEKNLLHIAPKRFLSSKPVKRLASALSVSLAAAVGTLPAMLACYQSVVLTGVVTNLIIVPLAGLLVAVGLPFAAIGAFAPGLMAPSARIIGVGLEVMRLLTGLLSFEGGAVYLPPLPLLAALVFLLAVLFVRAFAKRPKLARASAICVLAALALGVGYKLIPPPGTQVVMLDVGQGDSFLIRSGGKSVLIDAGSARRLDYGEAVVLPALRSMGVLRLDAAMMTHADDDHMGGLPSVLRSMDTALFIGSLADPQSAPVRAALERSRTPSVMPQTGDALDLGGATLTVVRAQDAATTNESSIAALLEYEGASVLFTGDLDGASEPSLSRVGEVNVLKVAHHGSRYSTTAEFVNRLNPQLALISVGNNGYGHPSPDVLARLEKAGASILRTDLDGAVFISIANGKLEARTMAER